MRSRVGASRQVPVGAQAEPADEFLVGRQYDRWLTGRGPLSLYMRWYLRHRPARELPGLLGVLGPGPFASVLDVGCATGVYLEELYRRGHGRTLLAGVDPGTEMIADATRRLLRTVDEPAQLSLHVATSSSLPFSEDTFDAVISHGVIKYLDDASLSNYAREAYRVLRPGGRMCVSDFTPAPGRRADAIARLAHFDTSNLRDSAQVAGALVDAGFVDVAEFSLPKLRRFPFGQGGAAGSKPGR